MNPRRKNIPALKILFISVSLLLTAAAVFFLFELFSATFSFKDFPGISFGSRKSSSWSVLEQIQDMEILETAGYKMNFVFPFDFTDGSGVDWYFLKQQYDRDSTAFLERSKPENYRDGIIPDKWKYADIYYYCRRTGIDPGKPDYKFLVIPVVISAGADINSWAESINASRDYYTAARPEENNGESTVLRVPKPPVKITSFVVEDRDSTQDGFPDVSVSPEKWRMLINNIEPLLREKALEEGLLSAAESGAMDFLSVLFKAAGYEDVEFEE